MMDATHIFGSDLTISSTGDIKLTSGTELSQQRILRRLLTFLKGYVWHPEYGAGLPKFIGRSFSKVLKQRMTSDIVSQMFLEASVDQTVQPQVVLSGSSDTINVEITYTEQTSNKVFTLSFNVGL